MDVVERECSRRRTTPLPGGEFRRVTTIWVDVDKPWPLYHGISTVAVSTGAEEHVPMNKAASRPEVQGRIATKLQRLR